MTNCGRLTVLAALLGLMLPGLVADDLRGADRWLCTAHISTRCFPNGECLTAPPAEFNVPAFVVVDLKAEKLSTTRASGENRATPVTHVLREDGIVFLQGVEGGRAFSFAVDEEFGTATFSVATLEASIGGFGDCTVLPVEPQ